MSDPERRRCGRARASGAALGLLLCAAAASAQPVIDPLVLKVGDTIGTPGGQTAIVVRTYASRPVRRGKIGVAATAPVRRGAAAVSPIASWDGGYVFDASGAVAAILTAQPDGSLQADFTSPTFSINRRDGLFAVFFVTLAAGLVPGDQFDVVASEVLPILDPENDPILIEYRSGRLRVRAPAAPLAFGVSQIDVQPGSGALLEIDTKEPFDIGSGTIVLHYDPNVLLAGEQPTVIGDPRHGAVDLTVDVATPGTITIDLVSSPTGPELYFNGIPGELLKIEIPTRPGAALGQSNVTFDAATELFAPAGVTPLPLLIENGGIRFVAALPGVFHDNFEIGDTGWWSLPPP